MNKVMILGDLHLRYDQPSSRTDVFVETMFRKLKWAFDYADDIGCIAVLQPGDLFHKARPVESQYLESRMIDFLRNYSGYLRMYCVPGNHDLPYHSMDEKPRSSYGVLARSGFIMDLTDPGREYGVFPPFGEAGSPMVAGAGWKQELPDPEGVGVNIGVAHVSIDVNGSFPGWESVSDYMFRHRGYDLLVTGDNHQQFIVEEHNVETGRNQILVNAGAFSRQTIAEIDFEPAVYIYDCDTRTVERVAVSIEHDVFQDNRKEVKERDDKIQAFVESMDENSEIELSFESNLEGLMRERQIPEDVEKLTWEIVESA